ncbi:MAG: hypothetical protein WA197_08245 [Candidatus Acidiferrales bacterium]
MDERKAQLKKKAVSEAKKLAVIVGYLAMLFVLLELHRLAVLREQNPTSPVGYRVGFALINALVLGKIILIADAFHLADGFKNTALIWAILFKSAVFSVLLTCCDTLEKVLIGVFHHRSIAQSASELGGGLEGYLLLTLMAFIVLIPFFAIMESARVIGEHELFSMIFKGRTS